MDKEQMYKEWLIEWKPKNASSSLNGGSWREDTLIEYARVLKVIVSDLKIDDQQVKMNLFEYENARVYLIAYGKIINHINFKSLQYFPVAKKSLKRYLDFLYQLK